MDWIVSKWTASGSDIEMLWFVLFLFAILVVVMIANHIDRMRVNKIMHELEIESIRRMKIK